MIILILIFSSSIFANEIDQFLENKWKLSKTQMRYFKSGKILADSDVSSEKSLQSFKMKALAKHKKSCNKVVRKLSLLEEYKNWVGFIKSSKYDSKNKLLTIRAEHTLLPYPMIIHIVVDRPKKQGKYPFFFPTGIFKGLEGNFTIKEIDKNCVFYATSFWEGKKTNIPNIVIEIFSETLSKIGGSILMRKVN